MAAEDVVTALAGVVGAGSVGLIGRTIRAHAHARKVAETLKRRPPDEAGGEPGDESRRLHAQLFGDIGALSLQEYVADDDARAVVRRAITRAETLVGSEGHIAAARSALASDDHVGALARARLALELPLRDLGAIYGLDTRRTAGGAIARQLARLNVIDRLTADRASSAYTTASRGLHGEDITRGEVEATLQAVEDVLPKLIPIAEPGPSVAT